MPRKAAAKKPAKKAAKKPAKKAAKKPRGRRNAPIAAVLEPPSNIRVVMPGARPVELLETVESLVNQASHAATPEQGLEHVRRALHGCADHLELASDDGDE